MHLNTKKVFSSQFWLQRVFSLEVSPSIYTSLKKCCTARLDCSLPTRPLRLMIKAPFILGAIEGSARGKVPGILMGVHQITCIQGARELLYVYCMYALLLIVFSSDTIYNQNIISIVL